MDLLKYIEDPARMAKLATKLKTSPAYLRQIATKFRGRTCGPKFSIRIEHATGGAVSRQEVRPDIFDDDVSKKTKAA